MVVKTLWLWKRYGCENIMVMETLWLWKHCGCENIVVVKTSWLWKHCGCANIMVMETLWLWKHYVNIMRANLKVCLIRSRLAGQSYCPRRRAKFRIEPRFD